MSDTNERSVASRGSVQPLAWAVICPTGEPLTVRWTWHECLDVAGPADEIIPLYRQQKPTLTDAEREAIEWAAREADQWEDDEPVPHQHAATLRGLLERMK